MKNVILLALLAIVASCSSTKPKTPVVRNKGYVFQETESFLILKINRDLKIVHNCKGYFTNTSIGESQMGEIHRSFYNGTIRHMNEYSISYFKDETLLIYGFAVNDKLHASANAKCEEIRDRYTKEGYSILN